MNVIKKTKKRQNLRKKGFHIKKKLNPKNIFSPRYDGAKTNLTEKKFGKSKQIA